MTKGPNRIVLDQYLDTAAEGRLTSAASSWKSKAKDLKTLGDALGRAAQQAELRIGEQTLTGPALRAGMEKSSQSLITKSEQLHAAGEALSQVGTQLSDARDQRDALTDLGEKPRVYQAPPGTPGVEPTPEEIQAQAAASQARQGERNAWQAEYDRQEARSLALTREMDAAFLGAIPPMKEIHGENDPTEPPPNVPSGPGGTYLPGTQAPPATGGGGGGNTGSGVTGGLISVGNDGDGNGGKDKPTPPVITTPPTIITETPTTTTTPTTPTHVSTESPTSTVTGTSQNGIAYQPSGAQASAPAGATLGSSGATAAALGAAGGAGGLAAGAVRPGAVPSSASGSTPVRAIGSTGRAGSAGALSRSAAAGSSAARSAATTGSPASRSAGSTAGRGAAAGGAAPRGGAGSRGAAGSTSGSRSGARGSSGARGAGAGSTGGRSGRKGERDRTTDRDSLVYDQDWLGDDDVAPGVLD